MSITHVQSNAVNSNNSVTSQAITLPVGATLGNLLIAMVDMGNISDAATGPTGWTQAVANLPTDVNDQMQTSLWYLVVDAANAGLTSWTWTFSAKHSVYMAIAEWNATNGWASPPLDKTANNPPAGTVTAATTFDSGTTPTTTQASELWVATLAYVASGLSETGLTSGWTKDQASTSSTRTANLYYQVASATGAADCAITVSSAVEYSGCIATFKPVVSATHALAISAREQFETRISALAIVSRDTFATRLSALSAPLRDTFLGRAAQSAPTRTKFIARAALQAPAREQFVERTGLVSEMRVQFATRLARLASAARARFLSRIASLEALTQGHFLVSMLHQMLAGMRSQVVIAAQAATGMRGVFASRSTLAAPGRASFATRLASLTAGLQSHFRISGLRQLAAQTHALFVERAVVGTAMVSQFANRVVIGFPSRARFAARIATLGALVQAHFLVSGLFQLAAHAHTAFVERSVLVTEAASHFATRVTALGSLARATFPTSIAALAASTRGRFATRIAALQATAQSRFPTRLGALAATTRSHFVTNGTVVIRPFRVSALVARQALTAILTSVSALAARFAPTPALTVALVRSPAVANPNSTIQVAATLTDINNNPVSTCSAVTCTVTFPDGTTSSFAMPASIVNAGAGKYTLTYTTKGPGVCLEDWVFVAADGVTTVEYHNLTPVEF